MGALCLWLSLRGVRLGDLLAEITSFSLPLLLLAIASVVVVAAAKALRWQWLYGPGVRLRPWSTHFSVLMVGQMLNLIIPIRLGEVARLGLMRQEGRPMGVSFGTIVVEKALDLLAFGLIVLLAAPLALAPTSLRFEAGTSGVLLGAALFVGLLAVGWLREPILRLIERLPEPGNERLAAWLRRARRGVAATLTSMASLRGKHLVRVTALTVGIWLLSLTTMQIVLLAFDLPLGWGAALALMLALTTSNWIPTPPAMIGVVGAITVAVLTAFGVDQTRSLAVGTLLNIVLVGPPVLLGGAGLWLRLWRLRETANLRSLRRAAGLGGGLEELPVHAPVQEGGHGHS